MIRWRQAAGVNPYSTAVFPGVERNPYSMQNAKCKCPRVRTPQKIRRRGPWAPLRPPGPPLGPPGPPWGPGPQPQVVGWHAPGNIFRIPDFFQISCFRVPPGSVPFRKSGQRMATWSGLRYARWIRLAILLWMQVLRWQNGGI